MTFVDPLAAAHLEFGLATAEVAATWVDLHLPRAIASRPETARGGLMRAIGTR
jgi:hypothetical protein